MAGASGTSAATERQEHVKAPSRTTAEKVLGKLLILLTLISFLFVGLLINCLQFALMLTIRINSADWWRRAHKRANGFLLYAIFAQPVFVLYVWSRVKLSILLADVRLLEDVQREMIGIVVANHTFELDWMACFILADQLGNMGSYKCFSKAELKYLPVIGWAFWMSDLIYVRRDWKHDRLLLDSQLDALLAYDQILLGIFAEGTRWTAEKQRAAAEFAHSCQLDPFKHHLFPRTRGFNYTLRHYLRKEALEPASMRGKRVRLLNLQIAMPDRPTFSDFLEGRQIRADVYCEEVELADELRREALESRHEDDCPRLTQLLRDIYRRKDELLDEYERHGQRFVAPEPSRAGPFPVRPPLKAFAYWLAGMSLTYGLFAYLATTTFAGSPAFWACATALLTGGLLMLKRIERESKPSSSRQSAAPSKRHTKLT